MAEHLSKTDSLCAPRQMRFPPQFIDDVQSLVYMLIKDIVDRYVRVRNCLGILGFFVGYGYIYMFYLR
jgi:hypothetical protein